MMNSRMRTSCASPSIGCRSSVNTHSHYAPRGIISGRVGESPVKNAALKTGALKRGSGPVVPWNCTGLGNELTSRSNTLSTTAETSSASHL